jgi:putative protein kinase ArgK-like GTPase of G3E family
MAALEAALEQAISGNAQVIGVVADPGTGRSRLCYVLAERCRARVAAMKLRMWVGFPENP